MPKELIAVAAREPVFRDYQDEPVPEGHIRVKSEFGSPKVILRQEPAAVGSNWKPRHILARIRR